MVKSYIVLKMYDELRKGRKIDLRARMKCTQWLPKWEGKETRCLI